MTGWTRSGVRRSVSATGLLAAALSGIIYMSPAEFAYLQSLTNDERRARLGMPETCRPGLTAAKMSARPSGRMAVLVRCHRRPPATSPPTPAPNRK
jgi:hypothetical protein